MNERAAGAINVRAIHESPLQHPKRKPYAAYKPSGVAWLGDVPAHWEVRRLKNVVWLNPETLPETTNPDFVLQYVDISNVEEVSGVNPPLEMRFEDAPSRARRIVRADDSILSMVRTYLKAIAHFENPPANLIVSTGFAVLRPTTEIDPQFLYALVRSKEFIETVVAHSVGVGYPAINPSELACLPIWFPPLSEQRAIAAYLDRETARLDTLIAKKEWLIELLQEQRSALISHAVTKGLDPAAPMKDSGVAWLGQVPAHWNKTVIKRLAKRGYRKFIDGDWIESPYITNDGVRLLQTGNVGIGGFKEQGLRYISEETFEELRCTEISPGDVLICRLAEPVGRACIAPDLGVRMITSVDVCILKLADDFDTRFAVYFLSSDLYLSWMQALCRGGTRDRVSRSMLGAIEFIAPPLPEQRAIATHLDRETAKIDALVAKVRQAIETLKEYRTALISAAVTGKIDLRGLQDLEGLNGASNV
jgi:type I restriction enzyme, S subunit